MPCFFHGDDDNSTYLEADEATMRHVPGCAGECLSSQPAAPVRHGLLPNLQGHCKIGGYSGAFQRGNHPNLPADHWHGAPTTVGTSEAGALNGIGILLCLSAKSNQTGPFLLIILSCSEAKHKGFH